VTDTSLQFRAATVNDLPRLTQLFNAAFAMWSGLGIREMTPEQVELYLLEDCQLVFDAQTSAVIASICAREVEPKIKSGEIFVERSNKTDSAKLFDEAGTLKVIKGKRILYLYGLAVDPRLVKKGLGYAVGEAIHDYAVTSGYDSLMLETGKDTDWLVDWYKREGFEVIGEGRLKSGTDTVMMLKVL